jgi:hypothetical protein
MKRDLHETLLRNSVARVGADRDPCSSCERVPLTGELVHDTGDGKHLCSLCVTSVPDAERESLHTERVHVGSLRLRVARMAAAA